MTISSDKMVVVDVGCRWGFAEDFIPELDRFLIYGFDPDPQECERLNAQYSSPAIRAVPIALGSVAGERALYLTKEPACSSLYKPDPYLTSNYSALHCEVEIGKTQVNVQRLDAWAEENGVSVIDHIKIDTQGSELDVLIGAGCLLNKMRSIQVEVEFNPMYLGQPVFSDIDKFLRSNGFVLWKLSEITHYSKNKTSQQPINIVDVRYDDWVSQKVGVYAGQIFWANAHYVRQDVLSDKKSPEAFERDQILFSLLGMPDVLGDQQAWGERVNALIQNNCIAAFAQTSKESRLTSRAQQAEARAEQAEARAGQAEAASNQHVMQLQAVYASTSWRITSPLRKLMNLLRSAYRT
jgi:FkbM family methyltransferase